MQVTKEMIDGKIKVYEEMMERERDPEKKAVWNFVILDLRGDLD